MTIKKIKAVFFDFDGVLTVQKSGSFVTNDFISRKIGLAYDDFDKVIRPFNNKLLLGELTHKDIWPQICNELKISIDYSILNEAFLSTKMNTNIIDIAKKLRKNFFIGMITDNKKDRIDWLRKYHNFDSLFSCYVISSQIGALKTEEKPFVEAVRKNGFEYDECIFIDNNKKNLVVPQKLGIHTIFYDDEKNDYKELHEILYRQYRLVI